MSNILIVGAGAAGLMAAKTLLEAGHAVIIVEALRQTGGRIHTIRTGFSRPVEAGAEFIHGQLPLTFSLLKEAGAKKVLRKGRPYTFLNGELVSGEPADGKWEAMLTELKKLTVDVDMASFLRQHFEAAEFDDLRQQAKAFAEGFDLADINRVSAMALRDEWMQHDDDHQYHVEGGYQLLIDFLESAVLNLRGEIRLATPVAEIRWSSGNVTVVTTSGISIDAEKIIVTVPLGVLQNSGIKFSPAIPQHQAAFKHMGFGELIKFMFEFRTPFWEQLEPPYHEMSFLFSDAEVPTWWTQFPDTVPLLTGWLGGPKVLTVSHDREQLYAMAIRSLCYLFCTPQDVIEHQLLHWEIVDWSGAEYSRGAYAYPTVQTHQARTFLSEPLDDTLYFAGEAFYEGSEMGTVEAALISGRDVATRIGKA